MDAVQILEEAQKLPIEERMYLVELLFKDMKEERTKEVDELRSKAAQNLLKDYQTNKEMIVFID